MRLLPPLLRLLVLGLLVPGLLSGCECGGGRVSDRDAQGEGLDGGAIVDGDVVDAADRDANTDAALPPLINLLINEIVAYPVSDWSRSDRAAPPFTEGPGDGVISSSDQYVELFNPSDETVDLRGLRLRIIDGLGATTVLGTSDVVLLVSEGSSIDALLPGHYALIGNPVGHISTDAFFVLRDSYDRVIDDVEVGGLNEARDYERDGLGDGAPEAAENGFARGRFEEAIARPAGSADTDVDLDDFVAMFATPLGPNTPPTVPEESVPPELRNATGGAAVAINGEIRLFFSESIDPVCAEEAVELLADGSPVALSAHTYEDDDATLVLNPVGVLPFDADIELSIHGGASGICDRAGNPMASLQRRSFHTEAAPGIAPLVRLNEVCVDPQQDWNHGDWDDSEGAFTGVPGTGTVSSEDEWIEISTQSPGAVNLSSYRVEIYAGLNLSFACRSRTYLGAALSHVAHFGSGELDAALAGDFAVIGDPVGSLPWDVHVALRDGNGTLVDYVEIGGNSNNRDRGGDGLYNGAPGAGLDGRASSDLDECVVRNSSTGAEIDDWSTAVATMGAAN